MNHRVLVMVLLYSAIAFSNVSFSVKPGFLAPGSATLGFLAGNRIEPYLGLEYFRISGSYETRSQLIGQPEQVDTDDFSVNLIMPNLGMKLKLGGSDQLKAYLYSSGFLVIPIVDVGSSESNESARDLLNFWGIQLGFGAEYFLAKQFSLGGEFGVYGYFFGADEDDVYDEGTSFQETWESKISSQLALTRSAISLNFYF